MRILLAFLMALNIKNAKQPVVKNSEATTKTEQGPQRGPVVSPHASQSSPMGEETSQGNKDEHQTKPHERVYRVDVVPKPFDWRDGLYVIYILATAIAAFVAWRALLAIKKQEKVMSGQLMAYIEGQRPQIESNPHGDPATDICDPRGTRVQIELHNKGLTRAYDCLWESWIEILPVPFQDFTANADHFASANRFTLYPQGRPMILNIPLRRTVTSGEIRAIKNVELIVCVRIRVTYKDAFSPDRYANFGFTVEAKGLSPTPKYNDSN